jgi:hypothetical protein
VGFYPPAADLLQLDGPVGVVQELFPALVTFVAEVDVDEGIAFRLCGFLDESQSGLLWGPASFFNVAVRAGADDI